MMRTGRVDPARGGAARDFITLAAKDSMRLRDRRMTRQHKNREAASRVPRARRGVRSACTAALAWTGARASSLIARVLGRLGRYRPLTQAECADARLVFAQALDLRRVRIAESSVLHRLLFTAQRVLQGGGAARPFVTGDYIHVPPSRTLERAVLIHELTHVWQARVYGPCYLWQALHAQFLGEGYDYSDAPHSRGDRRACDALGEGAQEALRSKPFDAFNREQQAQILMHYFVRRFLLRQSEACCAPWEAHACAVRNGNAVAAGEATQTPRAAA
jgi:hypothetical protein